MNDDFLPWIPAEAVIKLDGILTKDMNVLEYGSGHSTVWFASRCKRIISIEHNREWVSKSRKMIKKNEIKNAKVVFKSRNEKKYPEFLGRHDGSYKSYVLEGVKQSLEHFGGEIDILFIDGRARNPCMMSVSGIVNPSGWIVIDNTDRPAYRKGIQYLKENGWYEESRIKDEWCTSFMRRK